MKHLLIVSVLTVLPMSSQAEMRTIDEAIPVVSMAAQECSLYLNGSYYHTDDSDVQGEQLAAIACIKFMTGYYDFVQAGLTRMVEQLPKSVAEDSELIRHILYMNKLYTEMGEQVWHGDDDIDGAIQKELDEEKKDINPAIYRY